MAVIRKAQSAWGALVLGAVVLLVASLVSSEYFAAPKSLGPFADDSVANGDSEEIETADTPAIREIGSEDVTDSVGANRHSTTGVRPDFTGSKPIGANGPGPSARVPSSAVDTKGNPIMDRTNEMKYNLEFTTWKGEPQLLPNPLYIKHLNGHSRGQRQSIDIRGGHWFVIDITHSQISPVELFRGTDSRGDAHGPIVEARYLDGQVVNSLNTGFPIVRGLPEIKEGKFNVFENTPCLTRAYGVSEPEECDVRLPTKQKVRYRFEPPVPPKVGPLPDFAMSSVHVETSRGQWAPLVEYNDSFQPIGDANRDGYPDFYVSNLISEKAGFHVLLLSFERDDKLGYSQYIAPFRASK